MSDYERAFFRGFGLALATLNRSYDLPTVAKDVAKMNGIDRDHLLNCEPDDWTRERSRLRGTAKMELDKGAMPGEDGSVEVERSVSVWVHDDGGRAAAGYKGDAGDCVTRAIAIATGRPYQEVYDGLNGAAQGERRGRRKRGISNARTGAYSATARRYLASIGWKFVPTMAIGSGCKVHLRSDELPAGRLIVSVSKHWVAVIDGVIHDTHNPSRGGTRCVYGYFIPSDVEPTVTVKPSIGRLMKRLDDKIKNLGESLDLYRKLGSKEKEARLRLAISEYQAIREIVAKHQEAAS